MSGRWDLLKRFGMVPAVPGGHQPVPGQKVLDGLEEDKFFPG